MAKFIGNRCIPTPEGKWDKTKEYIGLSVVLDEKTGDSYTSKKVVPAGTELTNKDYWALSGQYNAQMALIKLQLEAMQNIPEGGTTADAALENIRIGADGTEYATPGDAVRGQVAAINENLGDLKSDIYFIDRTNRFNYQDSGIKVGEYTNVISGVKVSDSKQNESGLIPCESGNKIALCQFRDGVKTILNLIHVNFFNARKNRIGGKYGSTNGYFIAPDNAKYFSFNYNNLYSEKTIATINKDIPEKFVKFENHIEKTQWFNKKWYAYGTSLTNTSAEGKYAKFVEDFSGMKRVNKGQSGQGIVNGGAKNKTAIMNIADGKLEADLITIEVGANDVTAPLGTIYDTNDETFCGALNQCIRYLQKNTNAQIVVISSTNARRNSNGLEATPEYIYGTDNHTKLDQWEAIRKVCNLNSCSYIPMGENANMSYSRMNASDLYNADQIHHTELGGYNLGLYVWNKLKIIPCWYSELPAD